MRNQLQILACSVLLLINNLGFSQTYSGGAGTVGNPYKIANKSDLKYLSENSDEWRKNFIQTANITFTASDFAIGGDFYNAGAGFNPIGNGNSDFSGSYNGQGYIIDSLKITRPTKNYVGFIGFAFSPSLIKNLGITNATISGMSYVGGLVGNNYGTISNCFTSGSVSGNKERIGGLVGFNTRGRISDCFSKSFVENVGSSYLYYVGGLVGYNNLGIITNCYSTGTVRAKNAERVGGLVGLSDNIITNSYSTSWVFGSFSVGGLVGSNQGTISNSFSDGSADGNGTYFGGLVGTNQGTISNTYSTSAVYGSLYSGGLVGLNTSTIINSYSTGGNYSVNASEFGGLVGLNQGVVRNSFWNTESSRIKISSGGTGKNTDQMETRSTFTNATWDFVGETINGNADIWTMGYCNMDGSDYPIFTWKAQPKATNTQTFCKGSTIASLIPSSVSFKWYSSSTGGTALASTTELATGTYYVSEKIGNCESVRNIVSVKVNLLPSPNVSSANNLLAVNVNGTYSTTNIIGNSYSWTATGLPTITNDATNIATMSWASVGDYVVTVLETITATGCKAINTFNVSVSSLASTNALQLESEKIRVYPNPAIKGTNLIADGLPNGVKIQILSSTGVPRTEFMSLEEFEKYQINFDAGMYFIRIIEKEKSVYKRIVIQ